MSASREVDNQGLLSASAMAESKAAMAESKSAKAKAQGKTKAKVSAESASVNASSLLPDSSAVVDIRSMAIPDSVKAVLLQLDLEGKHDGQLTEESLQTALSILKTLKDGLDVDGSGHVSKLEMEAGVELLTRLAKDRAGNSAALEYQHLAPCIQGVMKEWDVDNSGKVSVCELAAAAQAFKKVQDEGRMLKKIMIGLVLVIMILLLGVFVLSVAAAEMAKESHVKGGTLTDTSGKVVATSSADFEVCKDGALALSGSCPAVAGGRLLEETTTPGDMLKTVSVKQKQSLSSSLPDSFFMALDEVAIFSDKGHSLRLKIHGFARVPVLNSRCGNIVHLYTAWNGRVSLDSVDLSFDEATEAAFANAGFSLITGGVSGRRLADAHSVDGFFSAVQGVAAAGWTCQDVPLPTLPPTYSQKITVYRPCAVEGVAGSRMGVCDSLYGGVVPGTAKLERKLQLATMSKTERMRASLSVDVPVASTLFVRVDMETIKSAGWELQITSLANHPGQQKVHIFDRKLSADVQFQMIAGKPEEGRFFCNSSGAREETTQKRELESEKAGIERKLFFEFMDLVEEDGKVLRHFRMMPAEAFLAWMGAKSAATRPKDAYYEYWDAADTLAPVRLLNPDGSLVVFGSHVGGTTDADVETRLQALGSSSWESVLRCSTAERQIENVIAPTLGMEVPTMRSPTLDLSTSNVAFYAKLNLDTGVEAESGNGWLTMSKIADSDGPLKVFATYALLSSSSAAIADVCRDVCKIQFDDLEAELRLNSEGLEFCDVPAAQAAMKCLVDVAGVRTPLCMKTNFMRTWNDCLVTGSATRRLNEEGEAENWDYDYSEEDPAAEGSELYLRRMGHRAQRAEAKPHLRALSDGTRSIDLEALDASQRAEIAKVLGVPRLSGGRILFNASDNLQRQKVTATLEANEHAGTVHSRRLMLDMNCIAPGIGAGCLFSVGFPWGCNPITGSPACTFGIGVKIQVGGPSNGALTVSGTGCLAAWAFSVPPPLSGTVCIDGAITVLYTSQPCGLPFSLGGSVGLTATVGLDLKLFSFSAASIRIAFGASVENYQHSCDDRRRRRRDCFGRRRGADNQCQTSCDIKVYAKATIQVLAGRLWAEVRYYCRNADFDFILGADIYVSLLVTSWWETIAQVQVV